MSDAQLEATCSAILTGNPKEASLLDGPDGWRVRLRCTQPSGDQRPDGLPEGLTEDPGFSFAVAEALLEVRVAGMTDAQREQVHGILMQAGTDDWIDYSHMHVFGADKLAEDATIAICFSSAYKGGRVAGEVLAALG